MGAYAPDCIDQCFYSRVIVRLKPAFDEGLCQRPGDIRIERFGCPDDKLMQPRPSSLG
jgi:hypothetical protein